MFSPQLAFQLPTVQRQYADQQVQQLLNYLHSSSPFYKKLFKENGISISELKTTLDLQLLPRTGKVELQENNMDFLCVPTAAIAEYTATSGTLGRPVNIALTAGDLRRLAYNEAQSFRCADGNATEVYQLLLTLDKQFMAGMAYYSGIVDMGATVIRTGPGIPAMQWDTIQRCGTTALVAVPSFLLKMAAYAKAHDIDLSKSSITKAICIGEGLRREDFTNSNLAAILQAQWPIKLYSTYAATEIQTAFTECDAGMGGHLQPDLVHAEILDEDGKPVTEGQVGEVTITTFGIEGMPLLRYRTGDIASMHHGLCSCGRHSPRLGPVIGRRQNMIKLKGTTLYPPAIFDVMNGAEFVESYAMVATTNPVGLDEVSLYVSTSIEKENCIQTLRDLFAASLRVQPEIIISSMGEIELMQRNVSGRKQARFLDHRIKVC